MKLNPILFNNDDIPIRYYYCCTENKEYILTGTKEGHIFNSDKSYNIGKIVISILEIQQLLFKLIEKYIDIISNINDMENNQVKICSCLEELQTELLNLNSNLFNCINFPKDISAKFIEQVSQIHIEKEKYNSKHNNILELEKIPEVDKISSIKHIIEFLKAENNKTKKEFKLLENSTFRSFTLDYLNNFLKNFSGCIFNFILYFQDHLLKIKSDNDKTINSTNKFVTAKSLQAHYNDFSTNSNIVWTKMAIIHKDEIYFENSDQIKSYNISDIRILHIFEFKNLIDLFNLSFVNIIDKHIIIKQCKNCGNYFIPESRTDEVYCNRICPQNPKKTCKEYGAKQTYREEIKSTPIKHEHNKTSQFYRMRINRAKNSKEKNLYETQFNRYKENYQRKKKKYNSNQLDENTFVEWIKNQKEIN